MNENQNVVVEEAKKQSKTIQKNLKFSNENDRDELNAILGTMEFEGATDGDKILHALKSVMNEGQRAEIIATANQTLAKVFESTFLELELMQRSIVDKYQALMTVANLEVNSVRNELTDHFEKKVAKLEKANERLEAELSSLKLEKEDLQSLINSKEHLVTEANTRVEDLTKALATKDLSIEALTNQLSVKDDLVEEYKSKAVSLNETIAQLTTDQQSNLAEMKELRSENKALNESYLKNNEVITKLTNNLEKMNIELDYAKKNADRYESEIAKLNERHETELNKLESRYQAELEQLRKELASERQSKTDLQSELIKLMSQMSQPTVKESDKSQSQSKTKKTFQVLDQKGKVIWKGSKNELFKYVNTIQSKTKVTTSTSISEIEDLLHPCILK